METHLGLAGGPAECEAVETVTQDGSFKDSCLKEDQRTRALGHWLEMVRASGEVAQHVCVTSGLGPGRSRH